MPMALTVGAEAMPEHRQPFDELDLIAVTVGPGAFTGLRIGLAAARGLSLATGVALAGVTTLEAVAAGVPAGERGQCLVVALETKRSDVYWQAFEPGLAPLTEAGADLPDAIAAALAERRSDVVLVGDAANRIGLAASPEAGYRLGPGPGVPDAAHVAACAAERWLKSGTSLAADPIYLRAPDVTLKVSRRTP